MDEDDEIEERIDGDFSIDNADSPPRSQLAAKITPEQTILTASKGSEVYCDPQLMDSSIADLNLEVTESVSRESNLYTETDYDLAAATLLKLIHERHEDSLRKAGSKRGKKSRASPTGPLGNRILPLGALFPCTFEPSPPKATAIPATSVLSYTSHGSQFQSLVSRRAALPSLRRETSNANATSAEFMGVEDGQAIVRVQTVTNVAISLDDAAVAGASQWINGTSQSSTESASPQINPERKRSLETVAKSLCTTAHSVQTSNSRIRRSDPIAIPQDVSEQARRGLTTRATIETFTSSDLVDICKQDASLIRRALALITHYQQQLSRTYTCLEKALKDGQADRILAQHPVGTRIQVSQTISKLPHQIALQPDVVESASTTADVHALPQEVESHSDNQESDSSEVIGSAVSIRNRETESIEPSPGDTHVDATIASQVVAPNASITATADCDRSSEGISSTQAAPPLTVQTDDKIFTTIPRLLHQSTSEEPPTGVTTSIQAASLPKDGYTNSLDSMESRESIGKVDANRKPISHVIPTTYSTDPNDENQVIDISSETSSEDQDSRPYSTLDRVHQLPSATSKMIAEGSPEMETKKEGDHYSPKLSIAISQSADLSAEPDFIGIAGTPIEADFDIFSESAFATELNIELLENTSSRLKYEAPISDEEDLGDFEEIEDFRENCRREQQRLRSQSDAELDNELSQLGLRKQQSRDQSISLLLRIFCEAKARKLLLAHPQSFMCETCTTHQGNLIVKSTGESTTISVQEVGAKRKVSENPVIQVSRRPSARLKTTHIDLSIRPEYSTPCPSCNFTNFLLQPENAGFYAQVLTYEPINVDELYAVMKAAQVRGVSIAALKRFLIDRSITLVDDPRSKRTILACDE